MVTWTDKVQAICSVLSIIVTISGFVFIGIQIRQSNKELFANTHERLIMHNLEILKFIGDNVEIKPFLYDEKKLQDLQGVSPEEKQIIEEKTKIACEIFTDLFEHVAFQWSALPKYARESWKQYALEMYANSYELRKFVKEQQKWYTNQLLRIINFSTQWP